MATFPEGSAFITVTAAVESVFFDGKGARLAFGYLNKEGAERTNRYTAWFDVQHGLTVGEVVTVRGFHSAAVESWTGQDGVERQSAKVNINNAEVVQGFDPNEFANDLQTVEDAPF